MYFERVLTSVVLNNSMKKSTGLVDYGFSNCYGRHPESSIGIGLKLGKGISPSLLVPLYLKPVNYSVHTSWSEELPAQQYNKVSH